MDELDRALIVATQGGLPLVSDPWAEIGGRLGISARVPQAARRAESSASCAAQAASSHRWIHTERPASVCASASARARAACAICTTSSPEATLSSQPPTVGSRAGSCAGETREEAIFGAPLGIQVGAAQSVPASRAPRWCVEAALSSWPAHPPPLW